MERYHQEWSLWLNLTQHGKTVLLCETLSDQSCFESLNLTIATILYFKHPLTTDHVFVLWKIDKFPRLVTNQRIILLPFDDFMYVVGSSIAIDAYSHTGSPYRSGGFRLRTGRPSSSSLSRCCGGCSTLLVLL